MKYSVLIKGTLCEPFIFRSVCYIIFTCHEHKIFSIRLTVKIQWFLYKTKSLLNENIWHSTLVI